MTSVSNSNEPPQAASPVNPTPSPALPRKRTWWERLGLVTVVCALGALCFSIGVRYADEFQQEYGLNPVLTQPARAQAVTPGWVSVNYAGGGGIISSPNTATRPETVAAPGWPQPAGVTMAAPEPQMAAAGGMGAGPMGSMGSMMGLMADGPGQMVQLDPNATQPTNPSVTARVTESRPRRIRIIRQLNDGRFVAVEVLEGNLPGAETAAAPGSQPAAFDPVDQPNSSGAETPTFAANPATGPAKPPLGVSSLPGTPAAPVAPQPPTGPGSQFDSGPGPESASRAPQWTPAGSLPAGAPTVLPGAPTMPPGGVPVPSPGAPVAGYFAAPQQPTHVNILGPDPNGFVRTELFYPNGKPGVPVIMGMNGQPVPGRPSLDVPPMTPEQFQLENQIIDTVRVGKRDRLDPAALEARLRPLLEQAFELQLQRHRSEVEELQKKWDSIRQKMEQRAQQKPRVIQRRLEDLLEQDVEWQPRHDSLSGGPATGSGLPSDPLVKDPFAPVTEVFVDRLPEARPSADLGFDTPANVSAREVTDSSVPQPRNPSVQQPGLGVESRFDRGASGGSDALSEFRPSPEAEGSGTTFDQVWRDRLWARIDPAALERRQSIDLAPLRIARELERAAKGLKSLFDESWTPAAAMFAQQRSSDGAAPPEIAKRFAESSRQLDQAREQLALQRDELSDFTEDLVNQSALLQLDQTAAQRRLELCLKEVEHAAAAAADGRVPKIEADQAKAALGTAELNLERHRLKLTQLEALVAQLKNAIQVADKALAATDRNRAAPPATPQAGGGDLAMPLSGTRIFAIPVDDAPLSPEQGARSGTEPAPVLSGLSALRAGRKLERTRLDLETTLANRRRLLAQEDQVRDSSGAVPREYAEQVGSTASLLNELRSRMRLELDDLKLIIGQLTDREQLLEVDLAAAEQKVAQRSREAAKQSQLVEKGVSPVSDRLDAEDALAAAQQEQARSRLQHSQLKTIIDSLRAVASQAEQTLGDLDHQEAPQNPPADLIRS